MAPRRSHEQYTVGIICALAEERAAVEAVLDEEHETLDVPGDNNVYTFGTIVKHNVVVASLPAGVMGKSSAATVAKDMLRSFPIKAGLMVGIAGGVWSEKHDIRLGDVVVSQPSGLHGGVIQWDFGKTEKGGVFRRTGTLNRPPGLLLNAVQKLKSIHRREDSAVYRYLQELLAKYPRMALDFGFQGRENDMLFEADYPHSGSGSCAGCDISRLLIAPQRQDDRPRIHYGTIASGDQVVKDGPFRDRIAREEDIICFEMEAAGLMDSFPCLVIRGICDYADSHKNKRWQPYAAATAACYAKELLQLVDPYRVNQLGQASQVSTHRAAPFDYNVPFSLEGIPVSDSYISREPEMRQMESFFRAQEARVRQRIFVVHGLGGMGKTQLCVAYARAYSHEFSVVLWLEGSSKDNLRQSLAGAARRLPLDVRPPTGANVDESIESLQQWLSLPENTNWLLVFDNVDRDWQTDDPQAYKYKDFLPTADHGNVLLTTRLSRLQRPGASVHLQSVSEDFALRILESCAGKPLSGAEELLAKLGGLPLALTQAGSYIGQTGMSVAEYLQHYSKTWSVLMTYQDRYPLQEYAERSVLTTWKISYEQVAIVKPEAARILDLWAFLSPRDIWYRLVAGNRNATGQTGRVLDNRELNGGETGGGETNNGLTDNGPNVLSSPCFPDKLSFLDSLGVLSQYSLVTKGLDSQSFSIHPVVHEWCFHNVENCQKTRELRTQAIGLVVSTISWREDQIELDAVARRLIPHARAVAIRHLEMETVSLTVDEAGALHDLGSFLNEWEYFAVAEEMYKRALQGKEEVLGQEHTSTLNTVNNLGTLYRDQGKLEQAEEMYKRALRGCEKALGREHTSTLNTVNNLGGMYRRQGKLVQAEEMYERALRGKEKALGREHTSTLSTVNNLGNLYKEQGKLEQAEEMYERALRGKEEVLGQEHTSTLGTLCNLGLVYKEQGKLEQAEEMYERALRGREKALGRGHASTLDNVANLGLLYKRQRRFDSAEHLFVRALSGYEKAEGDNQAKIQDMRDNIVFVRRELEVEGLGNAREGEAREGEAREGEAREGEALGEESEERDLSRSRDPSVDPYPRRGPSQQGGREGKKQGRRRFRDHVANIFRKKAQ